MPIVSLASPKGGVGKSTTALLLATELAAHGPEIVIIDGDPNSVLVEWSNLPGKPDNVTVLGNIPEDELIDVIEQNAVTAPFVFVDLEGTKNLKMSRAFSRSDLIIIPLQGSQIDARRASDAIRLIRVEEQTLRRKIPHKILFTRTSAAIVTRDERAIRTELSTAGIPIFNNTLNERAAFRAPFAFGGTLRDLPRDQVSNVDSAIVNAQRFAEEVVDFLREIRARNARAVA